MSVEVKQLGNEPIVIATIFEPIDMSVDPQKNRDDSNAIARKFKSKVYRITDFSHFELTFNQLTDGMADDLRLSEPNIVHVFVGSGELLRLQTEAVKQKQYGAREAHLFGSLDDAIAYARAQMKG